MNKFKTIFVSSDVAKFDEKVNEALQDGYVFNRILGPPKVTRVPNRIDYHAFVVKGIDEEGTVDEIDDAIDDAIDEFGPETPPNLPGNAMGKSGPPKEKKTTRKAVKK